MITTFADTLDLSLVHFIAALYGALTAVYVMQLWTMKGITVDGDCTATFYMRRISLLMISLSMLWSLYYSTTKGWHAWPPDVLCIIAVDILLTASIVIGLRREANERRKRRNHKLLKA